jgi:hypothetical protein
MTGGDWTDDDPDWERWARRVHDDVVPQMRSSAYVMSLVPDGEPDLKFAVELGLTIMFDKPLIAVVAPGARIPDKLVRVADAIVEGDTRSDAGRQSLMDRLQATIAELDARPGAGDG